MNATITYMNDQVSIVYEIELQYLSAPYAWSTFNEDTFATETIRIEVNLFDEILRHNTILRQMLTMYGNWENKTQSCNKMYKICLLKHSL